ncbi:hypothetical protein [Gymnodinialimonas hymeniacidonis]|uniref:hypothetical protein n=1 Tax=Gymnodinialimonas hymeniacidonis TaxID=3126508 RepID=UPI0034C69CCD
MKLSGPIITIIAGIAIFCIAWMAQGPSNDPNIGRGIANYILSQILLGLGGLTCLVGLTWLLVRFFDRGGDDS